ncbi:RdgB/HAM1 family non-canonical purine NTP pyrophosphatase [Oenococcus kitaharae]|uniref:dITP/XTP pyrophosphatase n=1 Tax=Oenococcus kitaharae DSM 17330 TaxID=1045004 RepID=G9WHZ9_9LACO|nr:RdgB/HAM1 family non-canonical purine NTP pyrophosphatase [Oenococcus kitaharae]EHN58884.1 Nucleoside 5-triphosphatase RdgB (dHAPTP dITPXTP-specific) [Oenococcus kitaharae DSM 17330]OEY81791.1 nucleoside-triphosphate diphosphatase [Oenococcus kitaharae]OEY84022.1 nucleoside-triphosphate diphosphatase [Oenococcus kitaharae]OEY85622.1 nucleoside-triphosphate diphosphatase [Oenococcus kitaharae]
MNKIILASKNAGKTEEIQSLLGDQFQIVDLNHLNKVPEINETGRSFKENAQIKARAVAQAYPNNFVMAEDTGLVIDALDGRPGIYSARYAGDHDDKANIQKVLTELEGVPAEKRTAHFTTVIVLIGLAKEIVAQGHSQGLILDHEEGKDGFGYDPIFFSTELHKTFGQATTAEKNTVSHRARALKDLISQITA